ncbi:MAG: hypothetical protein CMK07_12145 [Ponticaulis sp.]|nr:hypothetical protein [Ponticaulis sp.]
MLQSHPLLTPHLAPGETPLWQEAISDERFAAADARAPVKNGLLAFIAAILGLWFSYWGLIQLAGLLEKADYLTISFGAPIVIVIALALFWYTYMSIRRLTAPPLDQVLPALYALTSARLVAIRRDGSLADELATSLIEDIEDLPTDSGLRVKKHGDTVGDDAFCMVMLEDPEAASAAIHHHVAPTEQDNAPEH